MRTAWYQRGLIVELQQLSETNEQNHHTQHTPVLGLNRSSCGQPTTTGTHDENPATHILLYCTYAVLRTGAAAIGKEDAGADTNLAGPG